MSCLPQVIFTNKIKQSSTVEIQYSETSFQDISTGCYMNVYHSNLKLPEIEKMSCHLS